VAKPKLHWITDNSVLDTRRTEMGGKGQSVGSCSDNDNV
jgi:hypothetical protein